MGTVLLICGYLYIAIAVIFCIAILRRIVKKEKFTARDKALPVIIVGIGFLYIIALAFHYSEEIGISDRIQILLMFGLVAVTIFYAWSASRQADASVEMAEEMREQRYDSVRPVIDIERHAEAEERLGEGFAAKEEDLSHGLWCILRNIGVGPATDVYSFLINPLYKERQQWDFGTLAIGAATPKVKLSIEQRGDRRVLVVYYKDVHERCFESRREVSVDKERHAWNTGPLKTEVRKIANGEQAK